MGADWQAARRTRGRSRLCAVHHIIVDMVQRERGTWRTPPISHVIDVPCWAGCAAANAPHLRTIILLLSQSQGRVPRSSHYRYHFISLGGLWPAGQAGPDSLAADDCSSSNPHAHPGARPLVIHPLAPTDSDREGPRICPQGRCPPTAWRQGSRGISSCWSGRGGE